MSVSQRILQKNALFCFFSIYDENFHLLRSGDKKTAPCEGAAGGERRIWERMEKKWKDRKIDNSDFIDSVGDNL